MTRPAHSASADTWRPTVFEDFDRYCDEHHITPAEAPAAFAAWLNEATGWDGGVEHAADFGRNEQP